MQYDLSCRKCVKTDVLKLLDMATDMCMKFDMSFIIPVPEITPYPLAENCA